MATLDVRRFYADGDILLAGDFDAFLDDLETFLNTTKINDDNIQNNGITASDKLVDASISTAKLANLVVTDAKLNSAAVTADKIASGAVVEAKIGTGAVTADKIGTSAVVEAKIGTEAVVEGKLASNAVTTAKINDGAVTFAKLATRTTGTGIGNFSLSSSSGASTNGTGSYNDFISCSITTNGRPVWVGLVPDGSGILSYLAAGTAGAANHRIKRGSTAILDAYQASSVSIPPGMIWIIDFPSAGTYTYTYANQNQVANSLIYYVKLLVFEL